MAILFIIIVILSILVLARICALEKVMMLINSNIVIENFDGAVSNEALQNIYSMYNNNGKLIIPNLHVTGTITVDGVLTAGNTAISALNVTGVTTVGDFSSGVSTIASVTTPIITDTPAITAINNLPKATSDIMLV